MRLHTVTPVVLTFIDARDSCLRTRQVRLTQPVKVLCNLVDASLTVHRSACPVLGPRGPPS